MSLTLVALFISLNQITTQHLHLLVICKYLLSLDAVLYSLALSGTCWPSFVLICVVVDIQPTVYAARLIMRCQRASPHRNMALARPKLRGHCRVSFQWHANVDYVEIAMRGSAIVKYVHIGRAIAVRGILQFRNSWDHCREEGMQS